MDLRFTPTVGSNLQNTVRATTASPGLAAVKASAPGVSFAEAFGDALKSVSQSQQTSNTLQKQFQIGEANVSLEETMVAMQKAQIGFQAALTVRNKLVSAYTDVMNMSV